MFSRFETATFSSHKERERERETKVLSNVAYVEPAPARKAASNVDRSITPARKYLTVTLENKIYITREYKKVLCP